MKRTTLVGMALFLSCAPAVHTRAEPKRPPAPSALAQGLLGVEDEAFWSKKLDTSGVVEKLLDANFTGLGLDGPRGAISLEHRTTAPLYGMAVVSPAQVMPWSFEENVLLVASDLDRARVFVGMAAPHTRHVVKPSDTETSPPVDPSSKAVSRSPLDARKALNLPWEPAAYLFTLLSRDLVSNRVVGLLGPPRQPPLPAPKTAGLELSARGTGASQTLELRFALPAPAKGSALPVTWVLTGHRDAIPYTGVVELAARWEKTSDGGRLTGTGKLLLKALLSEAAPKDTYYAYVFAGAAMAGPVKLEF